MKVFSIIIGILLVICGFACMCTPLATMLAAGYLIGIAMLIFGILGIIRGIRHEAGAFEVVISVLAVIVGVFALFRPGSTLAIDTVLMYLISAWLVIAGIALVVSAIQAKETKSGWYWGLIGGIICALVGIYSFVHPMFTAVTVGILIGLYFVVVGFDLVAFAIAVDDE